MKTMTGTLAQICTGRSRRSILAFVIVAVTAVWGHAQSVPSDDAYVFSAQPNNNFGSGASLALQNPGTTTFVRFDLSTVPCGPN
jgi:hypothetical protein